MKDLLNVENLVELHEKLNEFANHYRNKGGQAAHNFVKTKWSEIKAHPRDGSPDGLKRDEGFDQAFKFILEELHKRFGH